MIKSFADRSAQAAFSGSPDRRLGPTVRKAAAKKLQMLHAAANLVDLAAVPGLRLEALKGDRAGQWSIRVNDQFRLCFRWQGADAYDVELADYH